MAKPLTQREIDTLLQYKERGLSDDKLPADLKDNPEKVSQLRTLLLDEDAKDTGALTALLAAGKDRDVQPYNFKRPRLFSQEKMRHLRRVHEAFARDLAVYLSAQLRAYVEIRVDAIDQVLYSEFVMASQPPSALYIYDSSVDNKQIVFDIDPRLVLFTVEKLCGGTGVFPDERREISQIEERIMSKVMDRAKKELTSSWKQDNVDLGLSQLDFETNAEFVQILPGNDPAMVVTLLVRMMDEQSVMSICYPYLLLENILTEHGAGGLQERKALPPPGQRGDHEKALQSSSVELRAELGNTILRGADILSLDEGDVIPLGQRVDRPINVLIDDAVRFKANPGRSSGKRSLQIVEVLLD